MKKYYMTVLLSILSLVSLPAKRQNLEIHLGESLWSSSSLTESIKGETHHYGPDALYVGYSHSKRLFYRNKRIKNITFYFVAGMTAPGLVSELDYYLYFTQEKLFREKILLEDHWEFQSSDEGERPYSMGIF